MTAPDVQIPGTKKPATKAGFSGFQVRGRTSEIIYMVRSRGRTQFCIPRYYWCLLIVTMYRIPKRIPKPESTPNTKP